MNNEEKLQYVKKYFLDSAINSIETYRRYWNSSISRTLVSSLEEALKESGYKVIAWEIPPQWEHVFYLPEDTDADGGQIKAIAKERYRLMEEGVDEAFLPK